jgi:predicted DNA-binding protein YlxM (UPF0122 family)
VNPDHLWVGTNIENRNDSVKKNRVPKGSNHWNSRLTKEQVSEIRKKYIPRKYTQQKLADEYGISNQTVSDIIARKFWTHI